MIDFKTQEKNLKIASFLILALVAIMQIVARRGLFADGAYFLVQLLEKEDFFVSNDRTRLFSYIFTQAPTILAVKLGMRNLNFLSYLFSASIILSPLLFWAATLAKVRKHNSFWLFLALFTYVYFNSSFFIIGEYNLSYALSAFCLAFLLQKEPLKLGSLCLLMGAAFILIMTYASTLFIGLLLAGLALQHAFKSRGSMKVYWLGITLLFIASAYLGGMDYFAPAIPQNKSQALSLSLIYYDKQLWLMAACLGLALLPFMTTSSDKQELCFILALALELLNLTGLFKPTPFVVYSARALMGVCLFIGMAFIAYTSQKKGLPFFRHGKLSAPLAYIFILPVFILFTETAFFDIKDSFAYLNYVDDFKAVVDVNTGFIEHEALAWRVPADQFFGWSWTSPSMSLILRTYNTGAITLNPGYGVPHQIFDPLTNLPNLERYYSSH